MTEKKLDMIFEYLKEVKDVCDLLDVREINNVASELEELRTRGGRLFILGVGGGAGNASHAVNDFRKLCNIEAYAPTDNVGELTARTNDEGWDSVFSKWLEVSQLGSNDALLIFSVGGGNLGARVSENICHAVFHAKDIGATVLGIVGRDGGYTKEHGDAVVVVPTVNSDHVTPHTESFQAVLWHLLVWKLRENAPKW